VDDGRGALTARRMCGTELLLNSKLCNKWASSMFGKPSVRKGIAVGAVLLSLTTACSRGYAGHTAVSASAQPTQAAVAAPKPTRAPDAAPTPDFAAVSKLMNDAIAAHRLPGAVVVIGTAAGSSFTRLMARASLPANRASTDCRHLKSR
jgi:hypothetical protein